MSFLCNLFIGKGREALADSLLLEWFTGGCITSRCVGWSQKEAEIATWFAFVLCESTTMSRLQNVLKAGNQDELQS
jgi:hypothetical protein